MTMAGEFREPTRFAPINDEDGQCVPSLYAAGTLEAAVYETISYHPPINSNLPEFGNFGITNETSPDGAELGFEERA